MTVLPSMEEIYLTYEKKVYGYIARRVNNSADAQELCSEVFTKVLAGLSTFDYQKASLSTWVYAVCRNTVVDFYRHNARAPIQSEWDEPQCELVQTELLPEDLLLQQEKLNELAAALARLPQRERDIIILRFYHGLPSKKVAEAVSLNDGNVRYLQSIALKKLRLYLHEDNSAPEGDDEP